MTMTRQDLVLRLHEATQIEHGLMIQYLYPALTMKKRLSEGLTGPQLALAREWESIVLGVAREEMGHLGTVCNLLIALGEPVDLNRPNFPQATGYFPFPFDLVPFGDEALYRMLVFELPQGFPLPPPPERPPVLYAIAPEPVHYDYVGELYEQIATAFTTIPESELMLGPEDAQVKRKWSVDLDLRAVRDRATALAALKDIVEDGEGAPNSNRDKSHYGRFLRIRKEFHEAGLFDAARNVVSNPQTRTHRDAGVGTLITNADTRDVAEVFNEAYAIVLMLLQQLFSSTDRDDQKQRVQETLSQLMSTAIRPLAEVLTELPAFDDSPDPYAGPPFELYDTVTVSPFSHARWVVLIGRMRTLHEQLGELSDLHPRLSSVSLTIDVLRRRLEEVAP